MASSTIAAVAVYVSLVGLVLSAFLLASKRRNSDDQFED